MSDPAATWRRLRELVRWHRRAVVAGLLAMAVLLTLLALQPDAPPTTEVWAAARDLPAGTQLDRGDLVRVRLPVAAEPAGVLRAGEPLVGRAVAGAVRRGEPLTDVRLVGAGLLHGLPGLVAAPVRLADAATAGLVQVGDVVDILVAIAPPDLGEPAPATAGTARVVATRLRVLAVPAPADRGEDGALVVVAAQASEAGALAQAAVLGRLSLVVTTGGDTAGS